MYTERASNFIQWENDFCCHPETVNMDVDRLTLATERFRTQQAVGSFIGGQMAVWRYGNPVVNQSIGFRREQCDSMEEVSHETLFPAFSCGKPLAALVIGKLEEEGRLDINAPIAEIFPEFARHGKGKITTLDVLLHRAGLSMPELLGKSEYWNERETVQKILADSRPTNALGRLAYAPGEYGWVLDEVVLRVSGHSIAENFRKMFTEPLGLNDLRFGLAGRNLSLVSKVYWLGSSSYKIAGFDVGQNFETLCNSEQFYASTNPAFALITTASNLAAFYDFLVNGGKDKHGHTILSEDILKKSTQSEIYAYDRTLGAPISVGRGFTTGGIWPSVYGWWGTQTCFGHAGMYSCLAFGDFKTGISVAILTNTNRGLGDFIKRFLPLAHSVRAACLA